MTWAPRIMPRVAYFCMEYGLRSELTLYAGGLGVLAGDYMKAAGELRLPVTGIGLLWSQGYGRQTIGPDGAPVTHASPTPRDWFEPVDVHIEVDIDGETVECRAFRVRDCGTAPLYLIEPADEKHRKITERLYGGTAETRIAQEILLGVGGVRLLQALGIDVEAYHFNEGHAVFAAHELIAQGMAAGASFEEARTAVRPKLVFTTHTPVPAGNEEHSLALLDRMGATCGLPLDRLRGIGGDPYGLTPAALRLTRRANAVAQLHGETARGMWSHVDGAAPIVAITNGVHRRTWQDPRIVAAAEHSKPRRQRRSELWSAHARCKAELLDAVAERTGIDLDPDKLLIGFARRATAYKRADLIFRDPDRVAPWLDSGQLQLLFAGKAHPADDNGNAIIRKLVEASRRWPKSVLFLENYDIDLGAQLTRGCDVWMNNPRRPMEASGTSGMKAAMNGVLNLSVLDGWWPEGCVHGETGWRIGPAQPPVDGDDDNDRVALLDTLEKEVMPRYYGNREAWLDMMLASIDMSHWRFSATRMVEDYYRLLYAPAR